MGAAGRGRRKVAFERRIDRWRRWRGWWQRSAAGSRENAVGAPAGDGAESSKGCAPRRRPRSSRGGFAVLPVWEQDRQHPFDGTDLLRSRRKSHADAAAITAENG